MQLLNLIEKNKKIFKTNIFKRNFKYAIKKIFFFEENASLKSLKVESISGATQKKDGEAC